MSEYKPYTLEELEEFLHGYWRMPIPTFWTITEPDPGGMLGGGGDNYIDEKGYFVYSRYDARQWSSEEECRASPEWEKYKTWNGYKVVEVSYNTKQPPNLSEEDMKRILIDLVVHKKFLRQLYPDAKFD